jgi:CheY-like chemotaxis protein
MMDRRHPRNPPTRPLVLLVDGHQDTRELYTVALAPLGFDVMAVADSAEAYRRIKAVRDAGFICIVLGRR